MVPRESQFAKSSSRFETNNVVVKLNPRKNIRESKHSFLCCCFARSLLKLIILGSTVKGITHSAVMFTFVIMFRAHTYMIRLGRIAIRLNRVINVRGVFTNRVACPLS